MIDTIKKYIPVTYRKKIKNLFIQHFANKINTNQIDQKIIKSWENNKSQKCDIINFSVISWKYRFQRPQQITTQLSKNNHRIFYINNEFLVSNSKNFPISVNQIDKNIFEINLSSTKNYFIYSDIVSKSDKEYIENSIKNLIETAKIKNPIIKIDHPFWYQVCKDLKFPIIYDCMDDHSQFKENSKGIIDLEKKLLKLSTNIVVSNKKLIQKYKKHINKITLIGNGVEYKYFSSKKSKNKPSDFPTQNKYQFGYYGAINSWIDENFIENILKNKDINFTMIGRVENKNIINLSKKHKNLFLLGEKPYSKIKEYLDFFDVCTIPFKLNDLILATDPVKLYEYMATGKPIISSEIPEVLKVKDVLIYNQSNMSKIIKTAINQIHIINKKNIELSKEYDWSVKAQQFENIINHCYIQKDK